MLCSFIETVNVYVRWQRLTVQETSFYDINCYDMNNDKK
jgi:hypothetical protein